MGFLNHAKTAWNGEVRCDWCGQYIKTIEDVGGMGVIGLVGRGIATAKKNYCSKACKLAAQEAQNGGSAEKSESSAGNSTGQKSGGGIGGMFTSIIEGSNEQMRANINQAEETRGKIDDVVNLQFETSAEGIENQLQNLFAQISSLPKFKTAEQKGLYKAIKEKLEFGIMKLNASGASAEADFFQKKFDKLK